MEKNSKTRKRKGVRAWQTKLRSSSNGDDGMFQIGKMRYVSVRDFKGKVLTDIRQYWMNQDGEMKLWKKGISPSPEQWNQLKDQISEIDDAIKRVKAFLSVLSIELTEHVGFHAFVSSRLDYSISFNQVCQRRPSWSADGPERSSSCSDQSL
uniref:Activated RNA polymerase II transcriptional coactivator p15 n=1 Tax=Amphiprion ocellaris TaxID=80972 RepID=A0A3Q1B770_AMPOC